MIDFYTLTFCSEKKDTYNFGTSFAIVDSATVPIDKILSKKCACMGLNGFINEYQNIKEKKILGAIMKLPAK